MLRKMEFSLKSIPILILRLFQFVGAIAVIVYYGSDLNNARKVHKYADGKWVFAVVVGSMAAVTSVVMAVLSLFVQAQTIAILFVWDTILMILWVAATGVFASMYFNENPEMDRGIYDMKVAAGFDLANFLLWFMSAAFGAWIFFTRGKKSLHTGRATI